MFDPAAKLCTAFAGQRLLLSGPLPEVALAVKRSPSVADMVLVFDDATGRLIDLDLEGSDAEVLERLSQPPKAYAGRHRPKIDITPGSTGPEEMHIQKRVVGQSSALSPAR